MIKDRIIQLLEYKGIPKESFYVKIGMTSASFRGNAKKSPLNSNAIENILSEIPDVNDRWLLTGDGEMLKSDISDVPAEYKKTSKLSIYKPDDLPLQAGKLYRAPIYHSYPVSAGNMGLSVVRTDKPDSYCYTTMPGVVFFPVVGCSFEPIIKAGSYIGVVKVDKWDRLDTEKIYFIVTHDDRMIKRLRTDSEDNNILWCVSPNFSEFKIYKAEIIEISHVFFYGVMV